MNLILVDCENCSIESVKKQIQNTIYSDIVLVIGVFQSLDKYRKIGKNIEVVRCEVLFKDAADFVLVATMVERIQKKKYAETIILSNDHGFDSAIKYLNSAGHNIRRWDPDKLLMPKGLASLCGYMTKNFESGTAYSTILKECRKSFNKVSKLLHFLEELGVIKIIRVKTTQVYFSKKKLKQIAVLNSLETWNQ